MELQAAVLNQETFAAALQAVTPEARQRFSQLGRPWDCLPDRQALCAAVLHGCVLGEQG